MGQNAAAADKLTSFLERMEHLLDEVDGLKDDLKDLKAQARGEGFNVAALVRLVAMRRNKRRASEEDELLNDLVLYAHATGTPLDFAFVDDDFSIGTISDTASTGPATAPADEVALAD